MLGRATSQDEATKVLCRLADSQDAEQVAALFRELQEFHHQPLQEAGMVLALVENRPPNFKAIVAEVEGSISGFALINTYPGPGIAPGFYLKELFVTASARKLGLGKLLMAHVARLAVERGYSRVDWITTKDNASAQSFYDRLGAVMNAEKIFYWLDGAALQELSLYSPTRTPF